MGYSFNIEYRRTIDFGQADGSSRLPVKSWELLDSLDLAFSGAINAFYKEILDDLPISVVGLQREKGAESELATSGLTFGWDGR